jgi:hypothetical protein
LQVGRRASSSEHGAFDFGAVAFLAQESIRGAKWLWKRFPNVPVERDDLLAQLRFVEPIIAEQLAQGVQFFCSNVAVVVFVVG